MAVTPPLSLIDLIERILVDLLCDNPMATSSESYVQHHVEFQLLKTPVQPPKSRYFLRIGINYHGEKVQHVQVDPSGVLLGWNSSGDALGIGRNAKMLLSGHTIFNRDVNEPLMSDTKIGGGDIPSDRYVRTEFKARGWLGKTKNLDGKQLEKDLDLLKNDNADLLVICLSETAHRKWRGEGPQHQAARRTGTSRFASILVPIQSVVGPQRVTRVIPFEGQSWTIATKRVTGGPNSPMPGADHYITMCWRN